MAPPKTAEHRGCSDETKAANHTPGPWHFAPENVGKMIDDGYGILFGEADSWGWEKNLYVSVGCSIRAERELGAGVPEANARLIAAAPDLLAVAKEAKDLLINELVKEPDRTVFWKLVAAIAKAEGR